jgi:hypothetical protein
MNLTRSLPTSPRKSERGSAVLVLLAFLTLMLILCAATTRAVMLSRHEVALIEKHQIARLAASTTNAPATPSRSLSTP